MHTTLAPSPPPPVDEVAKLSSKMLDVKVADIPVVDESVLLWTPNPGDGPPSLEDNCLSDWGKEVCACTW